METKRLNLIKFDAKGNHHEQFGHGHNHFNGERDKICAQAILVLGPLGSGKTSLVKWMLGANGRVFGKLRLIINDVGTENIDAGRLASDADLASEDLTALKSGCICCEDLESLITEVKKVANNLDTIVIEPTGIAEGDTIAAALKKIGVKTKVVTLMDVLHHQQRSLAERQIIDTQLAVAKVIGLTWWEKASAEQMEAVLEYIGAKNSSVPIVQLKQLPFGETEILGDQRAPKYEQLFEMLMDESDLPYNPQNKHHRHYNHHHDHGEHAHKPPVFSKSFDQLDLNFSSADLEKLLKGYEGVLIRAKGVVDGRRFDYVHGSFNWGKASNDKPVINFITSSPIDSEKLGYLLKVPGRAERSEVSIVYAFELDEKINNYLNMNQAEMLKFSEMAVANLIDQYKNWNTLAEQINTLKEVRPASHSNEVKIEALQLEQKELGEAMTFANPLVWMLYKIQAYANSPKALRTLADLRKHSSSPTYICYKRLQYLNAAMVAKFGSDLLDESEEGGFLGDTELAEIVAEGALIKLCLDKDFIKKWQEYEYFKQIDASGRMRVAKWENWGKN